MSGMPLVTVAIVKWLSSPTSTTKAPLEEIAESAVGLQEPMLPLVVLRK